MSPDEMNEREFVERLASLKPSATAEDPRIAFYNMGFAAASSSNTVVKQSKISAKRTVGRWLTAAAAIATCMTLAFLTGYSFGPTLVPDRLNAAAGNSRLSLRESSEEGRFRVAKDDTENPLDPTTRGPLIDPAYAGSRAGVLSVGLQDYWPHRELTAYGVSNFPRQVPRGTERSSDNQKTFVSTLTRMDYLNWEDAQ